MGYTFADIMFSPSVQRVQEAQGSRAVYANRQRDGKRDFNRLGPDETAFIAARDSFYMATTGETGWPYVQHRGGAPGFIKVLDEVTLGFADYRGNRQYISTGNLQADNRVSLFFMDYPRKARLKLLGHVRIVGADEAELLHKLTGDGETPPVERGFVIALEAFDWNCPKYITERFTLSEIDRAVAPLKARIAELESRLAEAGITG